MGRICYQRGQASVVNETQKIARRIESDLEKVQVLKARFLTPSTENADRIKWLAQVDESTVSENDIAMIIAVIRALSEFSQSRALLLSELVETWESIQQGRERLSDLSAQQEDALKNPERTNKQ
jgi:hypothetical protein